MLKLIIQDDEGKTTVVPLIRDEITIGRKEGNTIRLTERNVSRRHARIIRSNGSVLIEDLDSYNGIRVNGTRIAGRVKVAESDRIQIGDYLLELKVDRGAQADPFDSQATQPIEKIDSAAVTAPVPVAAATQPLSPSLAAATVPTEPQPIVAPPEDKPKPRISASQPGVAAPAAAEPAAAAVPPVSAPAPQPSASEAPARLVVLSANFAGREFVLDKAAMVIGRTEDNDIVVNHRSISRHHAKIVKEHGRYSIVDLQSSNGVRVNGEEYGKVELRRGDLVDLGHVRIRFIEPGEDFIYDRDAPALRASAEIRRSRAPLVAVLGVLVAGGAAAFFLLGRDDPGTMADENGPTEPATGPGPTTIIEPSNPTPTPPTPTPPVSDEVKKAIDAAQSNLDARKWAAAIAEADKALSIAKDDAQARSIKERAQAELADQKLKEGFDRAAARNDLRTMAELVKKMNPSTTTWQESSTKQNKAAEENGRAIIQKAARLKDAGRCDLIRRMTPAEWESTPVQRDKVEELYRECQKAQVAARDPKERNPDPTPTPTPTPPPQNNAQAFQGLLQEAKLAYSNKQYQRALGKSEDALDLIPGEQEAMSIAGMAACKLHNVDVANKYIRRLKGQRQGLVRGICLGEKVPVSDQ